MHFGLACNHGKLGILNYLKNLVYNGLNEVYNLTFRFSQVREDFKLNFRIRQTRYHDFQPIVRWRIKMRNSFTQVSACNQ